METFEQKLYLVIVDKLVIGLIIVIVGFMISKFLEKYKASQSLYNELAKEEIRRIGECWQLAYEAESIVKDMVYKAEEISVKYKNDVSEFKNRIRDVIIPLDDKSRLKNNELRELVEKNLYWMSDELNYTFMELHNSLHDYLMAYSERDLNKMKAIEDKIRLLKQKSYQVFRNVNSKR